MNEGRGDQSWLQKARDQWDNRGQQRPPFAIEPGPGQESVWDYPRPPAVVTDSRLVEVRVAGQVVASTTHAVRVLETSHPPSFYLPSDSIRAGALVTTAGRSHCEWKGQAEYLAAASSDFAIGWRYAHPYQEFAEYSQYVSFYPHLAQCFVDGQQAQAQPGGFYGGWITPDVVGPFKGEPGSSGW